MTSEYQAGPPPPSPEGIRAGVPETPTPLAGAFRCPECGAKRISAAAVPCWLCRRPLPEYTGPMPAGRPAEELGDNPAFIVLGVLAILLCVGLMLETPGVAIILVIAAVPALVRASYLVSRRPADRPVGAGEAVGTFLASLGVVAVVGVAAGVAFFATCFAVCLGIGTLSGRGSLDALFTTSILIGLIPGVAVFIALMVKLWPRKS